MSALLTALDARSVALFAWFAGCTLLVCLSCILWLRARTSWAREALLAEQIKSCALQCVKEALGLVARPGRLLVLDAGTTQARFAVMIETDDASIATRAAVTRLEHGAISIATTILTAPPPLS